MSAYLTKLKNQTRNDNERTESEASANKKNSKAAELSKASNLFDVPRCTTIHRHTIERGATEWRGTEWRGVQKLSSCKSC